MLCSLSVRNLLLIESLDLDFQPGLNVLTGETGAGKSILLDCLGMVLGWRGRADLIRIGADQGEVTAEFQLLPDHPANAVLAEAGWPADEILILRRVTTSDGRKSAYINDRRATAETIRALSDTLVEIHGQHDDRGLLDPKGHLALLDEFAASGAALHAVRAAWKDWRSAESVLSAAQSELQTALRDAEFLRYSAMELTKLNPQSGEETALDTRRRLMQAAARIRADVAKAAQALAPEGAEGLIADAVRWLQAVAVKAEGTLDAPIEALSRLATELADAQSGIERALQAMDFDPSDLEQTEERLFALRGLARKHNVLPDDLETLATEFQSRLEALDTGARGIRDLETAVASARQIYESHAAALRVSRTKSAKVLDAAVQAELGPLKLDRAQFSTELDLADPGPDGIDRVTFTVATNPGAPSGPINKIASGGELSRFLLALKVCLTANSTGLTMIFDEIDRGVGGATADAVGRRLAALAQGSQIIVVTHSPQVAARGSHHILVEKTTKGSQTRTEVSVLTDVDRTNEIARMLSADTVTDAARAAALELLQ